MEDRKQMKTLWSDTIRALVKRVNELEIKKEDIVTIVNVDNDQYCLIYYNLLAFLYTLYSYFQDI